MGLAPAKPPKAKEGPSFESREPVKDRFGTVTSLLKTPTSKSQPQFKRIEKEEYDVGEESYPLMSETKGYKNQKR